MDTHLKPAYHAFLKYRQAKEEAIAQHLVNTPQVEKAYQHFTALVPQDHDPDALLLQWDANLTSAQHTHMHQGG